MYANQCYGLGVLGPQREGGLALAGTIYEQPNGLVAFQLCHRGRAPQIGHREERNRPNDLTYGS